MTRKDLLKSREAQASKLKFHTQGDGTFMPRTGIWVDPATGRWGMISPMSEKARRIQELYDAERGD